MDNDRSGIENQLFEWEEWSEDSPANLQFSNVTLKVPVGDFPVGTKFELALLINSASLLILMDEEENEHAFDLKISVGDRVDLNALEHDDDCDCHDHSNDDADLKLPDVTPKKPNFNMN
jgi:hypothetical protein